MSLMNGAPIQLRLLESDLWTLFQQKGNEMIITKNGRCMFPLLRFRVFIDKHINKDCKISFSVRLERCDNCKWKFRGGEWKVVGSVLIEENEYEDSQHFYEPNDSPNSAAYWIENGLSFAKIKLTNRLSGSPQSPPSNYFCLGSFRRYRPVVYSTIWFNSQASPLVSVLPITIPFTEFIAVTHYQNEQVTELKKNYNPHAKGFLALSPPTSSPPSYSEFYPLESADLAACWVLANMKEGR